MLVEILETERRQRAFPSSGMLKARYLQAYDVQEP